MARRIVVLLSLACCLGHLVACNSQPTITTHATVPLVANPAPFTVYKMEPVLPRMENRRFGIQAPVGEVPGYAELFARYGFEGNGPSWVEHIRAILAAKDPDLLSHLEFDEEGDTFLVYADSQQSVNRFMQAVQPVFATPQRLKAYLSQADPSKFAE